MRLVRESPAIPEPIIYSNLLKWFPFLFYDAQVFDLRKLLEFYYFLLSIELLFFHIIYISLFSSLYHWFFFSVLLAFWIWQIQTLKKIFYLLWSWHTLYFWVLMLSLSERHYQQKLLLVKWYIYNNNWYFTFCDVDFLVPVCRWRKWCSGRYHAFPRTNQWVRAGTRTHSDLLTPNFTLLL